ncbi:biotin/lipoyl-containing protein [uncultured Veillonella sp.]|uniref:biotin/lipoyl-containing protein n=1 Tax=uncultured Veillonella sp. TaxID=159268 RepID=UPI0025E81D52|nr:biotin/lipoyl-containing protein [uncultured Veillonella sp.]
MKKFVITVNGTAYDVEVNEVGGTSVAPAAPVAPAPRPAATAPVAAPAPAPAAAPAPAPAAAPAKAVPAGAFSVNSPMPGKIISVAVKAGDTVSANTVVCILEAMKMQNEIVAQKDGVVADVRVAANQSVKAGEALVVIE